MEPGAIALQTIAAHRVAIATYYGDELNEAIAACFARFGLESTILGGYSATGQSEGLYTTPLRALDDVGSAEVYRYCKAGVLQAGGRVDALYINGGGWDYVPLVAGGTLICLFSLERMVLRLAGQPIDDILDELPPAEVAAELDTAKVKA